MSEPSSPDPTTRSDRLVHQDRKDLLRGAMVNGLGYIFKIAVPAMTALVVRFYGADAFGLFIFAQAVLLFISRLCLVGLDKALLWWIPQQRPGLELTVWAPLVRSVVVLASLGTFVLLVFAGPVLERGGGNPASILSLRIMALALVPMTLMELLLAACVGLKRMAPNVVVKESVLPISTVGLGLVLYPLQLGSSGLAIAFTVAYFLACALAWGWWRKLFAGATLSGATGVLPPPELRRYAVPMWFTEMSNSFLQRMDVYAVATVADGDMRMVGIYGTVVTIANAIRQIRRSFDPIVLVITAEIGASRAKGRLREGFSYATYLVTATQLPVLGFIIAFAPWLMKFFGKEFGAGTSPVIVLTAFWVLNSAFSLAGIVVQAHGHAKLTLANVWLAIGVQAVALWQLVPAHGLMGAALSVGIAYTVQSIAQVVQMRWLTGAWNYTPRVAHPVLSALVAGLAAWGVWIWVPDPSALQWRALVFVAFVVVYAAGVLLGRRT